MSSHTVEATGTTFRCPYDGYELFEMERTVSTWPLGGGGVHHQVARHFKCAGGCEREFEVIEAMREFKQPQPVRTVNTGVNDAVSRP